MSVFIISYDLRKPDFDYEPLYGALAELDATHLQDSVWGVNTTSTAAQIFDYLWEHVHSTKDRLFVVPFDKSEDYKSQNARPH
jgi:hypothetical protein